MHTGQSKVPAETELTAKLQTKDENWVLWRQCIMTIINRRNITEITKTDNWRIGAIQQSEIWLCYKWNVSYWFLLYRREYFT